jgi:hypothetical protein
VTGSDHSAGGQAVGYVHQSLWALVELGRRAADDPAVELRLEGLDDIQFDAGGTPVELLQTKHHIGDKSVVTATSVQLWRSLNVWMDAPSDQGLILRLITTSTLDGQSALAGLRAGAERNVGDVLRALISAAVESTNKVTAPWRERFLALDETKRELLIERIFVEDGSPRASELRGFGVNISVCSTSRQARYIQ